MGQSTSIIEHHSILVYERFFSENSQSLEQPPQGCGKVPINGGWQGVIGYDAK